MFKEKKTYADYVKETPEGWGHELIDGVMRDMAPAPYTNHQRVLMELALTLGEHIKKNGRGIILLAPTDVYFDAYNCVQPDLLFISKERKHIITRKNIQGAPDVIMEVVSPHHRQHDTVEKKKLYEKFEVKEFWLVFPQEEFIEIYLLAEGKYALHGTFVGEQLLQSPTLEGFSFVTKKIFIRSTPE